MTNSGVVRTRHLTLYTATGKRLKKPGWSRARVWKKHRDTLSNLKQAIAYAQGTLERQRIGTVVYVGGVSVYHAKWGGGKAFTGWKSNPAASYWQKRV